MNVTITFTSVGADITGPFDLYSNTDPYPGGTPFETNVSLASFATPGYTSTNAPAGTTEVTCVATVGCGQVLVSCDSTTTTTSSSSTSTSTSTTSSTSSTTTTSTTGEPTTTTTTTNEVMLSCSDFGVSFENNLPGYVNQWSAWINLPVAATGDTDFEIGFTATRNDTLGSCNTTINVTVLSGQTMGVATSMTCIENIQHELWTVDSWEIVSTTPYIGLQSIECSA